MLISSLKLFADEESYQVKVQINITCPMSIELQAFLNSIPRDTQDDVEMDFYEWKYSFINNMYKLIELVDSEKLYETSLIVDSECYSGTGN